MLALMLPAHAQAAPRKEPAKAKAAKDPYAGVQRPASPEELLRNLKFALEHHLLLSDVFYEEKTLQRFFGNRSARWFKLPRPFIRNGRLLGLDGVFASAGGETTINVLYKLVPEGDREKRRAMIGIDAARDARATADTVIRVFGVDGRVVNPGAAPAPGTHRFGNKLLVYEFDGPQSKGNLNIQITVDGGIGNIIAVEEQKGSTLAPLVIQPPPAPPAQ
ncbi:MAG TPA: hypothetical protein VGN52_10595 [Burkholderiales bacterium]